MTATTRARRLPKRSAGETRALMLRAATELAAAYTEQASDGAVSAALAHIRLTDVAAKATELAREETGRTDSLPITTGAIYQVWPSQADFQADLLFHIAEVDAVVTPDAGSVDEQIRRARADRTPAAEIVRDNIEESFAATISSAATYIVFSFYALAANPRVRAALKRSYDEFAAEVDRRWQALLTGFGLRVRAPYTIDDLATAITATLEGFAMRSRVDPDRLRDPFGEAGWSLVSRTVAAIFTQFTEPVPGPPDRAR